MMWRAVILCLLLWPASAVAQVSRVQTGEHDAFTRVVLTIPTGANWRLGRSEAGYVLRVPGIERYDLSGFYDLIPRDRIVDVAPRAFADELQFTVSCPCTADAFLFRPDVLVIDISDGAPGVNAAFEAPFDPPPPSPVEVVEEVIPEPAPQTPFEFSPNRLLPVVIPRQEVLPPTRPPEMVDVTVPTQSPAPVAEPEDIAPDTRDDIAALEAAITRSLAQGLSAGALDGAVPEQGSATPDTPEAIADALDALALPGVTARTGVDPLARPDAAPADVTQEGDICLPDSYFAVGEWGTDDPFFAQINPARSALLGEFDVVDSEAVTTLAKLYLHFGFGREARRTMELDQVQSQERRYLAAMGRIIDEDPLAPGLFDRQVSCPGLVALWAMLATSDFPFDAKVDRSAVLRNFRALPEKLQAHLGPRLSDRFLAIGDTDASLQVMAPVSGAPAPPVEAALADANLQEALGEEEAAIATVTEIAREDPRVTPAAMARFFDDGIAAGKAFTDEDFLTADALRFEYGESADVAALTQAQIRALTSVDRFGAADAMLNQAGPLLGDAAQPLADDLVMAVTDRQANADFLDFVWTRPMEDYSVAAQNAVADRLLSLGFAGRALGLLEAEAEGDMLAAQSLLRARAHLATGRVDDALRALEGLNSDAAEAVRTAAIAARELQATTALLDADLAAVPAERALDLIPPEDEALAPVDVAVREEEPLALNPDSPLAQSRALLERSGQSRDLLEEMLNRFALPSEF